MTPDAPSTAESVPLEAHLSMQAALQAFVDSSISKTINVPREITFAEFAPIYLCSYEKGLKGCTAFRSSAATNAVLTRVRGNRTGRQNAGQ